MHIPQWLVNLSELCNKLTCGPKGYSLCARFYKNRLDGKWHGKLMVCVSDRIFWFDEGHCRTAYLWRQRKGE